MLRVARRLFVRALAGLLFAVSVGVRVVRLLLASLVHPSREFHRVLRSRKVLWPWLTRSSKLLIGTIAYNAFVLFLVQPLLRAWFPPLSPWEHVQGIFGHTRTTYEHLVPIVSAAAWILGNGLLFAYLEGDLRKTQAVIAEGGAAAPLTSRTSIIR